MLWDVECVFLELDEKPERIQMQIIHNRKERSSQTRKSGHIKFERVTR